jgi:hypothetical protein
MSSLTLTGGASPTTPPSGKGKLFMKVDKKWYVMDDTGTEYMLEDVDHTHVEGDIIDLDKYTQNEIDNFTVDAGYF